MKKNNEILIIKKTFSILFLLLETAGLAYLTFLRPELIDKFYPDFLKMFVKYFLLIITILLALYFTLISAKQLFVSNVYTIITQEKPVQKNPTNQPITTEKPDELLKLEAKYDRLKQEINKKS